MSLPSLELPPLALGNTEELPSLEIPSDFNWVTAATSSTSEASLAEQLQLPAGTEFITNFECEEASGFGADLLWGYVVEQKGGNAQSPTTAAASSTPNKSKEGGNYHQQQRGGKKAAAAPQPKQSGTTRGELPSNATGAQIINLTSEDYETDWYAILAIEDEGCSENELKSAFRRRCLETHPDKRQGSDEEFKQVQRAFEILANPDARRQFDSARSFDDTIPPADMNFDENPKGFFDMFKGVFQRNARWSIVPVQVTIGDENTPVADVRKFYDFWMSFRSWRDFSHVAELEEIHEGMPRYEKRFYQQENERILNSLKKQEAKRIRSLVDRAMAADPRLRADARRQEEERLAVLEARREAQFEIQREKDRQEREAKEKELAAAQEAKEAGARQRQVWKDSKQSVLDKMKEKGLLRDDSQTKGLIDDGVNIANIDWIFAKVPFNKNPDAVAENIIGADDADIVANFNKIVLALEKSLGMTRYGEPMAVKKEDKNKFADDMASSAAARKQSQKSAAAIAAATGSTNAGAWSEQDIIDLTKAIAKYPGGTVDRWRKISIMLRDKFTEEQILIKTKQLEHTSKSGGAGAVLSQVTMNPTANEIPPEEDWTPPQQSQLEEGLRAMKDYKEKDKWIKVGGYVTGKTAKQCFERYKHLCNVAQKAKK